MRQPAPFQWCFDDTTRIQFQTQEEAAAEDDLEAELLVMHQEAEEHRMEDWEAELFKIEIVHYQPPDPILAGN